MGQGAARVSPRAVALLRWVVRFHARWGYMPTAREIAVAMGMRSHTGARYHLTRLERGGYVVCGRGGLARTLIVTQAGYDVAAREGDAA